MDGEDGDFKKGRFNPAVIGVGVLLLVGAGAAAFFATKTGTEKMTVEQIATVKKGIYLLPRAEQVPKWQELSKNGTPDLQQEALTQLSLLNDKSVVAEAATALGSIDHRVRGTAAQALVSIGLPDAEPARAALMKAFREADSSDKPQISWALVALNEKSLFKEILEIYKAGHLASVQRIGGGRAFDIESFARMASPDEWSAFAEDPNDSVRQLVAGILSKTGDKKYTAQLIKLVNDPKNEVAREAASGLGKIGDSAAMTPLLSALTRADKDDRQNFLEALRDGIGGEGLVLAIGSSAKDPPERNKFQTKQVFDMLRTLEDPRAANALVKYLASKPPHAHWMTEAALRLAEVGDLRSVPYLADRLKLDPLKIYDQQTDPEYRRDDNERVVSARMLADLAVIHPEAHAEMLAKAEDAVLAWATEKPQPHANALRFLAATGSKKAMPKLREWANPTIPLPKAGESGGFPMPFETAHSALRYLGWTKDEGSWATLEKQVTRKEFKLEITQDAMLGAGVSMLGMVLRGLAVGASQGFAQWGDKRAYPILMKLIEDEKHNEGAREEACRALGWVATDENMKEVLAKAKGATGDAKKQFLRACLMESVIRHPVQGMAGELMTMLSKDVDFNVRRQVARAIGWPGVDKATEDKLFEKMKDKDMMNDAALALLLGGSEDAAARAVARFADAPKEQLDDLKDVYFESFGFWSDDDLAKGRIYRWVANAESVAKTRVRDTLQDWARLRLGAQFNNLEYDSGPHSMTRVVLRYRLIEIAKKGDNDAKRGAIETLKFMKEQGSLMALRDEKGDTGELAKKALFEVLNPKSVVGEKVPEAKKAGGEGANVVPPK
jgi:HEAT repeat protein